MGPVIDDWRSDSEPTNDDLPALFGPMATDSDGIFGSVTFARLLYPRTERVVSCIFITPSDVLSHYNIFDRAQSLRTCFKSAKPNFPVGLSAGTTCSQLMGDSRKKKPTLIISSTDAIGFLRHLKENAGARSRILELRGPRGKVPAGGSVQLPPSSHGNSIHIQATPMGKSGKSFVDSHSEPDSLVRPVPHINAAVTGKGVDWNSPKSRVVSLYKDYKDGIPGHIPIPDRPGPSQVRSYGGHGHAHSHSSHHHVGSCFSGCRRGHVIHRHRSSR